MNCANRYCSFVHLIVPALLAGCAVAPPFESDAAASRRGPHLNLAPAVDPTCLDLDHAEGKLRMVMGWSRKTLARAKSATGLESAALCALSKAERDRVAASVRNPPKAEANGMIDYLRSMQLDDNGNVPVDGIYNAVQEHNRLLELQAESSLSTRLKAAGISPPAWTSLGPRNAESGRVRALHIDPRNPAIVIAGTASGGIWRTTNAGTSWSPVNGFSPAFSITGLRMDPNNPDVIYASTGEFFQGAGIWKSVDNGATWHGIPATAPGRTVAGLTADTGSIISELKDIAVSRADSQILVAPGRNGIFVTRDGGLAWRQVAPKAPYPPSTDATLPLTYFVSFDPTNARKAYVGTDRGTVIVGTGIGTATEAWTERTIAGTPAGTVVQVGAMAWSGDGSSAWIVTSEARGTVYRSTDGGGTFTRVSAPGQCRDQCWWNNSLWVDPTDPKRVVLGGVGLHRSSDGGVTWVAIDFGLNNSWIHSDHHAVVADPRYDGKTHKMVYFGSDGGVYRNTDITAPAWGPTAAGRFETPANAFTWENFGKGIDATQFFAIAANAVAGTIIGGTQDNGTFRHQADTSWVSVGPNDGGFGDVPAAGTPYYITYQRLSILRSPYSDTDPSVGHICDGITETTEVTRRVWNEAAGSYTDILVCGTKGQANKSLFIAPMTLDPNHDKRMYAGGQSLWVSNDVSTGIPTWRAIKPPLPPGAGATQPPNVSSIAIAPGHPDVAWVGYDNGQAYRTTNARAAAPTWEPAFPALTRFRSARSIFISPTSPQRVLIVLTGYSSAPGSANSVYRTVDGGLTWTDISGNLPKTSLHSVVEHPLNSDVVFVGSDTGVYATADGITWSASNDGPALVPVHMLRWYDSTTLLAATHGRGVWRASVPAAPANSPICTLTASPTTVEAGSPATLTASCVPEATSFAWTNSGLAASASSGTVTPTGTTIYSVVGVNAGGGSNIASATVGVVPKSRRLPPQIAAGDAHSVLLKADGSVWTWGRNDSLQLGTGTNTESLVPVRAGSPGEAIAVAAGSALTMVLRTDGTLWTSRTRECDRGVERLKDITAVAPGPSHGLALRADGTVWAWGSGSFGQLGNGTPATACVPLQVTGITDAIAVAAAGFHSLALRQDGTVVAWGSNSFGQLGNGTTTAGSSTPLAVAGLTGVTVAAGDGSSYTLKPDGTIWAWGANYAGQLGNNTTAIANKPVQVVGLSAVTAIAAGRAHAIALKNDGTVWAWGANEYGQLGNGTTSNSSRPVQIPGMTNVAAIAAGHDHTLVLKSDGSLMSFGSNFHGQIGNGKRSAVLRPAPVSLAGPASEIAFGFSHMLALMGDGTVRSWGNNSDGALGNNTTLHASMPVAVSGLAGVKAIAGGDMFSLALRTDGTVHGWGSNLTGQLGVGNSSAALTPKQLTGISDVAAIAAGQYHALAAKADGSVWSWGLNGQGRLGNGTTSNSTSPVQVSGLGGAIAVAARGGHSIALKSDGTVWSWGDNSSGQLGNGATTQSLVPVQTSGLAGITAISAGNSHSVALKHDGTVWTWGYGTFGSLGHGNNDSLPAPKQVAAIGNVTAIAAGHSHTLAVKNDGSVWAWGYESDGQLGNAAFGSNHPVKIADVDSATGITAGAYNSAVRRSDGSVLAFGDNTYGQIGNGAIEGVATPVVVLDASGDAALNAKLFPPQCRIVASTSTAVLGTPVSLTAICIPAASSYAWTNTTFQTATASGIVSPATTTTYSVTGTNADGPGNKASVTVKVVSRSVIEFYNRTLDNYFITADPGEASAVDRGAAGPGWVRTGVTFRSGGNRPVCRFYGSQSPGPNSHFYTVDPGECDALKAQQLTTPATERRWNFESLDFSTTAPVNGQCPDSTIPVFRAYNNGFDKGRDSNHRLTTSALALQEVLDRGWKNEGVVMCAAM